MLSVAFRAIKYPMPSGELCGGGSPTSGMDEINFFGEAVNVDLQCPVLASQLLHLLNLGEDVGQEVKQEAKWGKELIEKSSMAWSS